MFFSLWSWFNISKKLTFWDFWYQKEKCISWNVFQLFLAKISGKEKRLWYAKVKALLKYCPPLQLPYFRRKFSLHKLWIPNFNLSLEVQVRSYWLRCKYQSISKRLGIQIDSPSIRYRICSILNDKCSVSINKCA